MNPTEQVNQWLSAIGDLLGFPLQLNAEGRCALALKQELVLTLALADDAAGLSMAIPLLTLEHETSEHQDALLRACLKWNHVGGGDVGGVLALDPPSNRLLLTWSRPLNEVNLHLLAKSMLGLLAAARDWRTQWEQGTLLEMPAAAGDPPEQEQRAGTGALFV